MSGQMPSIGRIVHYNDDAYPPFDNNDDGDPENWIAGIIIAVHNPECVNLVVWDQHGNQSIKTSVVEGSGRYGWRWPPRV